MILKDLNINLLAKLLTQQLEQVTCFECCKCYAAPVTAECGHTLCNGCWYGRRQCPVCALTVERKILKLNLPLQSLTDHVQALIQSFDKLFNIKLAELELETTNKELQVVDSNKNVTDWLANSQNQFSAPISTFSTPDLNPHVEYLTSKVQIHTSNVKASHQPKVASVQLPLNDDWDKIEVIEESEDCVIKNQQNVIEPMDIESMDTRGNEYTTENPRRSTRKKETINSGKEQPDEVQNDKADSTKSSTALSKQPNKMKQTWNHAKRMRQEFSRLNKENRNKLNVSIETFKTSQVLYNNTKSIDKQNHPTDITKNITSYELNKDKEIEQEKSLKTKNYVNPDPVIASNHNCNKNIPKINDLSNKTSLNIRNEYNTSIHSENQCDKEDINSPKVKFFKKGALHVKQNKTVYLSDDTDQRKKTDDIEITIRVGKTITNVCIKQKDSDPQLKIRTDREIQTSLEPENFSINITAADINKHNKFKVTEIQTTELKSTKHSKNVQPSTNAVSQIHKNVMTKSDSSKKNTASADTRTAQFEISVSSEKDLPDIIESVEDENKQKSTQNKKGDKTDHEQFQGSPQKENIPEDMEDIDDLDLIRCEFSKSPSVQSLKASKNVPSTILVPTQNKLKKCTQVDKRIRNLEHDEPPLKKKQKLNTENVTIRNRSKVGGNDSECSNYDLVMEKVFANIDADIEIIQQDNGAPAKALDNNANSLTTKTQVINLQSQKYNHIKQCDNGSQKDSENLFSNDVITQSNNLNTQTKPTHNETLTPNLCREFTSLEDENREKENMDIEIGTPHDDGSDASIVEETPQKNVSSIKVKQKSGMSSNNDISEQSEVNNYKGKPTIKSVVDLCNSVNESYRKNEENTVVKKNVKNSIVTPLTINKFVEQIQHKSTPVARKSLNFNIKRAKDDPEQTLCKTSFTETTQEKEFMNEVFQEAASSPVCKTTAVWRQKNHKTEICVAGSCLMAQQVGKLKRLCRDKGWRFVDEYTNDVTHLVIDVDEENKSKRSIKYMRALAAGKWIVGYAWVEKCIQSGTIVPEEPFECLDSTGEPGPRRSRLAKRKLFAGIAFYCMSPFSMLTDHILKEILENAGGSVVSEARDVRATEAGPAFVLAEPENTQDAKYTYLAMDLSVVPVHSEWVLNCLGCYSLLSIQEVLLCPASVLPEAVSKWPSEMLTQIN